MNRNALIPEADVEADALHQLLALAGANVSLGTIRYWTEPQRTEAATWAQAQIAAWAKDKPGIQTSVFWPEHVSAAHVERDAS